MSDNIDFKALWQQLGATPPDAAQVIQKAQHFRRRQRKQIVVSNLLLLFTGITIGAIWWYFQPQLWTTKLGIVLIIIAIIMVVVVQNKLLPLLFQENSALDNRQYLELLRQLKYKKTHLQNRIMGIYFVLLSLGLALYFYEYTLMMSAFAAGLCYGMTALWILFNWLYIRPRVINRQQEALADLQKHFEALEAQFKEA
jgi:hypothetical protein